MTSRRASPDQPASVIPRASATWMAATTLEASLLASLTGDDSDNFLEGQSGDDTLDGQGGHDTLFGHAGDDSLIGGTGVDTAVYAGSRAGFTVTKPTGTGFTATDTDLADGDEGVDTLSGVEKLRFADGDVQVSQIGEFRVNTQTRDHQGDGAIAALSDGGCVVVWFSYGQDGDEGGIYGQRYGADGQAAGGEFRVNSVTANHQTQPTVTGLKGGGFAVMWASDQNPNDTYTDYAVHGQRFGADGAPLGDEFLVSGATVLDFRPSLANLAGGGFVVAWYNSAYGTAGIHAQRYAATGAAVGDAILVTQPGDYSNPTPAVAGLAGGGFVVTWDAFATDGSETNVYGQRYAGDGTPLGAQFRVNTYTSSYQDAPAIAALAGGGFVITWSSYGQDGDGYGIYGQRYAANGTKVGGAFRVNATTVGDQYESAVTALANGGFVVTWTSLGQDDSAYNVMGQRYDADGLKAGGQFLVNSFTDGVQGQSSVAGTADGGFVVSWQSDGQDSDLYSDYGQGGIYAQRYDADGNRIYELALSASVGTEIADNLVGTPGNDTLSGLEGDDTLTGLGGDDRLEGGPGVDTARYAGAMADHVFSNPQANGFRVTDARTGDGDEGTDSLTDMETASFANGTLKTSARGEFQVGEGRDPALAVLSGGDFVVAWTAGDGSYAGINAQRFGADGYQVGATFRVNTTTWLTQESADIAALPDGGYLVAWDSHQDGSESGIYGQRYDAGGAKVGGEFQINTHTQSDQLVPAIAVFADGGFVVAWNSYGQDGSLYGAYGQRFDASAAKLGTEFRINQTTEDNQVLPHLTVLANGGFLATWMSGDPNLETSDAYGRLYGADGAPAGDEFVLNTHTDSDQGFPIAAALPDGGFVAVWHTQDVYGPGDQDGSDYGVFGQRFDAGGSKVGGEFQVNTTTAEPQSVPNITHLADGGFVVVWISGFYYLPRTEFQTDIYGQRYDADCKPVGDEFRINTHGTYDQQWPDVAPLANGGFVVAWENTQEGTVYARRFDANGHPVNELTLTGSTGNDTLRVGAGVQILKGGPGNDIYIIDGAADRVVENGGEGMDTIKSSVSYTLPAQVEHLTLTGGANLKGTGNALANVLTGNSGANVLTGLGGADTLNGGGGADTMKGGAGNDTYVVDQAGDVVTEYANQGTDTVRSSLSYVLGAHVEHLVLTGAAAIDGTGNALANTLAGNGAANVLDGGAGADSLAGGAGNDTYIVDSGGDLVSEQAGEGNDTVRSGVTYALTAHVEHLVLTGAAAIDGTGNALANTLAGNDAANVLDGGAGADSLAGGLGNDTYVVDDPGDVVSEQANQGIDTVRSGVTHTLAANVEHLELTGVSAVNGSGNALANTLSGNGAANRLWGNNGADRLLGHGGNDTLYGGNGADTLEGGDHDDVLFGGAGNDVLSGNSGRDYFVFNTPLGTGNVDTLTDFTTGIDRIRLDDDVFTALGPVTTNTVLASERFHAAPGATAALDADDCIIHDTLSGTLYYDPDATGELPAIPFAVLGTLTHPDIGAGDFVVIA